MVEVAETPAATDKSQESWDFSESESWRIHEKEVTGKLVASRNFENSGNSKAGSKTWPHHFHMSPVVVPHVEKVHSIVRQIYGRSPTDDSIWGLFMNVTLSVKQLFHVTEKLIKDQTEISGLTTIDFKELRSLCDKAIEIMNAKTYVFADSLLCLGSMSDQPVEAQKNKNSMVFGQSPSQRSGSN